MANLTLRQELAQIEKGKIKSVWVNPEDKKIYLGETVKKGVILPTFAEPVFDLKEASYQRSLLKEGKTDALEARLSPWIGEWENIAHEALEAYKTAGVVTSDDYATINVVNVAAEMQGIEIRDFVLDQAVTVVSTPNLLLSIDLFTRGTASQEVPEGVVAGTFKGSVARTSFELPKDVGHIAITDEAQMKAVHDLYRAHVENAATDLKRIKTAKIATVIESASATASADWAAFTSDHNTTDPKDAIGGREDAIIAANGMPNTIASHGRVYRDYTSSGYVKGPANANLSQGGMGARVITNIQGLEGYTWYVDNSLTNTKCSVYDKRAFVLAQGPVRAAQYRDEKAGMDGYIIRDFNQTKLFRSSLATVLTSVSA